MSDPILPVPKRWRKLWLIPIGLTLAGGLAMFLGIAWAVNSGVAVPDPDPTTQVTPYATRHNTISQSILAVGLALFAAAVVSLPVVLIVDYVNHRRQSNGQA